MKNGRNEPRRPNNGWDVELECGHTIRYSVSPPMPGERVWCFPCDLYREVVRTPGAGVVKCRSCSYLSKGFLTIPYARKRAQQHQSKYPAHRLVIMEGRAVIERIGARNNFLQQSFDDLLTSLES